MTGAVFYRRRERPFAPWKNGGGQTAEILVSPTGAGFDDFDWRISTAIVAASGPFSRFAGVGRVLTILEGGPMRLTIDGQVHHLDSTSPPLAFSGDALAMAEVGDGPVLDLNVMVRAPLQARVLRGPLHAPPGPALARFALLTVDAPALGLEGFDLVDFDRADAALCHSLASFSGLVIVISAGRSLAARQGRGSAP